MTQALQATQLVIQQESFFKEVATSNSIHWAKESQFAIQALQSNESLGKVALQHPASLQNALINVGAIGISLNPALKHAYLVPRKPANDKPAMVCLDISYQGLLHLAQSSGAIEWGQAKLVYENDEYTNEGIDKPPHHKQKTFGDKGRIIGVYCTVKTKAGDYLTEEMDIHAIQKVQNSSKAQNGPWKTWWEEMARKTVVKRASKYWPSAESLGRAIDVLNEHEGFVAEKDVVGEVVADTVTEEQVSKLRELMEKAQVTEEAFVRKCQIGNIEELYQQRFEGACKWLESKA